MKIHQIIIIIEMDHAPIVPINTYVNRKIVNLVIKNHLLLIHRFTVGVLKTQTCHENYSRVQKPLAYLIVIYVILNLNQNYTMS
jgi:hypothetical protein